MKNRKIAICGVHGTGKSNICERIETSFYDKYFTQEKSKINKDSSFGPTEIYYNFQNKFAFIPEQFREVVKDLQTIGKLSIDNLSEMYIVRAGVLKQTEEITLATYAKQLYLENLYTAQEKNILCDRSVLDTFVYYVYFNGRLYCNNPLNLFFTFDVARDYTKHYYNKIYLIEPSDREIENDDFRLTDKKQQLEIHKLFLEYFEDFNNVVIVNQEEQDKIVEMIVNDFSI